MFTYYTNAIKQMFDYKGIAKRKELNLFILNWFLLSLLIQLVFCLVFIFGNRTDLFLALNINGDAVFDIQKTVIFWFNIINIFALLGLQKRRLNDLTPQKALPIFIFLIFGGLLLITWPFIIHFILTLMIKFSIGFRIDKAYTLFLIIYYIIAQIIHLILMIKK